MPKKSPKKVFFKEQDIVKYRWEFFIRNPKNREEFNKIVSFIKQEIKPIKPKFLKYKSKVRRAKGLEKFIHIFYKRLSQAKLSKEITNIFKSLEKELGPYIGRVSQLVIYL